ncbi:MAG: carbohydrate-binding family 9-like protein [Verrucomicrobiota bacterium]
MNNQKLVVTTVLGANLFILLLASGFASAGELETARPYAWDPYSIPVYPCCQIADGAITIDGKLDEACWTNKPELTFQGLRQNHSKPDYHGTCRILWDSKYLYVGYDLIEPDVWATIKDAGKGYDQETRIMHEDMFVKFFVDPDGDGLNYIEIHVNPANAVADVLTKWPYSKYAQQECGLAFVTNNPADWDWAVTGLITAVHVEGTLNNSQDVDRGWSVEMALPWDFIQKYAKSPCPPAKVRTWRCHVGRVHREKPGGARMYWTWPVFDVFDCHAPAQWGILVFTGTQSMGWKIYSIGEKDKMTADGAAFSRE